jgi:predicted nuclease of restriction endonuclease-like (RecB) superfamily
VKDLRKRLGRGFGRRNLFLFRDFYLRYPIVQSVIAQLGVSLPLAPSKEFQPLEWQDDDYFTKLFQKLSWTHLIEFIRIDDPLKRAFYELESLRNHWSVRELKRQRDSLLYERVGLSYDKEGVLKLAQEGTLHDTPEAMISDPYVFEFLGLKHEERYTEAQLETAMLNHVQEFLLEMGKGFCFVARQRRVTFDNEHHYIDLLLYNRRLKCLCAIDLVLGHFRHEYAGAMNFYLNYLKAEEMEADENPPIGLILCSEKNQTHVEYALGGLSNQVFVSEYLLHLPGKEELEAALQRLRKSWKRDLTARFVLQYDPAVMPAQLFASLLLFVLLSGHSLAQEKAPPNFTFVNIAREAGITAKTIYGGEKKNQYQLENVGSGIAWFDFDHDGWLDLFQVNGTRLVPVPGEQPTNHLYRNNRNGTFTDVTDKAGLRRTGWGQGACIGDYDNDGFDDLFVTYYGENVLYKNNGNGTFTDVTKKVGLLSGKDRWGSGAAFVDYDKDGHLDLFVANYINFDLKKAKPLLCPYRGVMASCGHTGMPGGVNLLYRNNGDGTFTDVSEKAGITKTNGTYGLGVLVADFNNDRWPDVYVANDMSQSALYRNNKNGTFTDIAAEAGCAFNLEGKVQAGMGVTAGDYDGDGWFDIFKTNFSDDTSTLYRNLGKETFDDVTFTAGLGVNTRWLGWGCGFFDPDNDGWLDLFLVNGHIYPEVDELKTITSYRQRKVFYRNKRDGKFEDISAELGSAVLEPNSSRGCAFGDFDNDGDIDIAINAINSYPELLRCDSSTNNNWIKVRLIGTKSNRSGIGARIKCEVEGHHVQMEEVRSGGSYYSQNDLRVHFGLGKANTVKKLEIQWPSGTVETLKDLSVNQILTIKEGAGIVKK